MFTEQIADSLSHSMGTGFLVLSFALMTVVPFGFLILFVVGQKRRYGAAFGFWLVA
jgi:hypothetical protein